MPTARRRGAIGILGGSFNPAHAGHRRISQVALAQLPIAEVWWLVSPGNPLKSARDMAPLAPRFASAQRAARGSPIRVSAIEQQFGTRFTVDTLARLVRRYPRRRFIWLMGADNLAQLHRWRGWRRIARIMPIAVIGRPGYDSSTVAAPAMAWLGRFRRPPASLFSPTPWSLPRLVLLPARDHHSASATRRRNPSWGAELSVRHLRDGLTHKRIDRDAAIADPPPKKPARARA